MTNKTRAPKGRNLSPRPPRPDDKIFKLGYVIGGISSGERKVVKPITEEELQRRRKEFLANTVVAGPDHPIYGGGLRTTSVPSLKLPSDSQRKHEKPKKPKS